MLRQAIPRFIGGACAPASWSTGILLVGSWPNRVRLRQIVNLYETALKGDYSLKFDTDIYNLNENHYN